MAKTLMIVCCQECLWPVNGVDGQECDCDFDGHEPGDYIEPCLRLSELRISEHIARDHLERVDDAELVDHLNDIQAEVERREFAAKTPAERKPKNERGRRT